MHTGEIRFSSREEEVTTGFRVTNPIPGKFKKSIQYIYQVVFLKDNEKCYG
jgi:hypothetical protein